MVLPSNNNNNNNNTIITITITKTQIAFFHTAGRMVINSLMHLILTKETEPPPTRERDRGEEEGGREMLSHARYNLQRSIPIN